MPYNIKLDASSAGFVPRSSNVVNPAVLIYQKHFKINVHFNKSITFFNLLCF